MIINSVLQCSSSVWQCARQSAAVRQCAAVRHCVAVRVVVGGSASGTKQRCAQYCAAVCPGV
jgi:hypothetical protein